MLTRLLIRLYVVIGASMASVVFAQNPTWISKYHSFGLSVHPNGTYGSVTYSGGEAALIHGNILNVPRTLQVTVQDWGGMPNWRATRYAASTIVEQWRYYDAQPRTATYPSGMPGNTIIVEDDLGYQSGAIVIRVAIPGADGSSYIRDLSTRGIARPFNSVGVGFTISGANGKRRLLITVRGPSLSAFGVSHPNPDVKLRVYGPNLDVTNSSWRATPYAAAISAAGRAPADDREASFLLKLPPGEYAADAMTESTTEGIALLSIEEWNEAPAIAWTGGPTAVGVGEAINLSAQGTDPDGNLINVRIWNNGEPETNGQGGGGDGDLGNHSRIFNLPLGTYNFFARSVDGNGVTATTAVKTVTVLPFSPTNPPYTNYVSGATDLRNLFLPRDSAARAADTGMKFMYNGVQYDLSDLFRPRTGAARANVNFRNTGGTDLSQIFETR